MHDATAFQAKEGMGLLDTEILSIVVRVCTKIIYVRQTLKRPFGKRIK
jgi:hypothetical protein